MVEHMWNHLQDWKSTHLDLWYNKLHPSVPASLLVTLFLVYHNWWSLKFAAWPKPWVMSLLPVLLCILYQIAEKKQTQEVQQGSHRSHCRRQLPLLCELPDSFSLMAPAWPQQVRRDALPRLLIQGKGSPAPAALFWTKKRIETWCSSSWQSTTTARQLCKTGQYQAARGFSRSDLTCQALCIDAVRARHFCLGHD